MCVCVCVCVCACVCVCVYRIGLSNFGRLHVQIFGDRVIILLSLNVSHDR